MDVEVLKMVKQIMIRKRKPLYLSLLLLLFEFLLLPHESWGLPGLELDLGQQADWTMVLNAQARQWAARQGKRARGQEKIGSPTTDEIGWLISSQDKSSRNSMGGAEMPAKVPGQSRRVLCS